MTNRQRCLVEQPTDITIHLCRENFHGSGNHLLHVFISHDWPAPGNSAEHLCEKKEKRKKDPRVFF